MLDIEKTRFHSRTLHPGVKLLCRVRVGGTVWLARWFDPDSRRAQEVSLHRLGLFSEEARRAWCATKSRSILQRRADLLSGAAVSTTTAVTAAVGDFFIRRATLAKTTLASYRNATNAFICWTRNVGVATAEALTPKHLMDFRAWWAVRPAQSQACGEHIGRGKRIDGVKKKSPLTINRGLGVVRAMLNELRIVGVTPKLSSDLIRDTLKFEKRHRTLPHFLRINEIGTLVEAALKHDAEKYELTREEHDGHAEPGSTARYAPITPFMFTALLTGCRFGELASLRWASVSLAENEIVLSHSETKTRQARRIDLTPTPMLAGLLRAMQAHSSGEFVFGGTSRLSRDVAEGARKRLIRNCGAPRFSWHCLRKTCGTFLTCAPGIYSGASAYLSAKRLGHSVAVAEAFYVGALTTVDKLATTLEAAMCLKPEQFDAAAAHWRARLEGRRELPQHQTLRPAVTSERIAS